MILETLLPLLALIAISIMQSPTRHAPTFYGAAALLGTGFVYFGWEFVFERSRAPPYQDTAVGTSSMFRRSGRDPCSWSGLRRASGNTFSSVKILWGLFEGSCLRIASTTQLLILT